MEHVLSLCEPQGMLSPDGKEHQPTQHNACIVVPSELNDSPPYWWMHRCPPYAQQPLSFTPQWIHPMLEESLPLAPPGHPCHCPPSKWPCWLAGGCANPHHQQCKPTLGELLPLVQLNYPHSHPVSTQHCRFARRPWMHQSMSPTCEALRGWAPGGEHQSMPHIAHTIVVLSDSAYHLPYLCSTRAPPYPQGYPLQPCALLLLVSPSLVNTKHQHGM